MRANGCDLRALCRSDYLRTQRHGDWTGRLDSWAVGGLLREEGGFALIGGTRTDGERLWAGGLHRRRTGGDSGRAVRHDHGALGVVRYSRTLGHRSKDIRAHRHLLRTGCLLDRANRLIGNRHAHGGCGWASRGFHRAHGGLDEIRADRWGDRASGIAFWALGGDSRTEGGRAWTTGNPGHTGGDCSRAPGGD